MSGILDIVMSNIAHYKKHIMYRLSLYYKLLNHNIDPEETPWWHEITDGIILGAVPLKNYHHDKILAEDENVGHIISVVQDFEITTDTFLSEPVRPCDWQERGVQQVILDTADFNAVSLHNIRHGVAILEEKVDESKSSGKKIYLHCKAGHSRSNTIMICYLIKTRNMTICEAFNFVKSIRPTVGLNDDQYNAVLDYYIDEDK